MDEDNLATVAAPARVRGHGLHTGRPSAVAILPSPPGNGISFRRADLPGSPAFRASWDRTGPLVLSTTVRGAGGVTVATVEHLMAALSASGVDDAEIAVDGPEVPILDGSAAPFMQALSLAGRSVSRVPRRYIRVLRPVTFRDGGSSVSLLPSDRFSVSCEIDFEHPAIGRSHVLVDPGLEGFRTRVAAARTFALLRDVERMRASGLALGGSLDNAVVVGEGGVLNPGGLRYPDEFARHKALDAVGDLALAGAPMLCRYVGVRAGHASNNAALAMLMADTACWEWSRGTRTERMAA